MYSVSTEWRCTAGSPSKSRQKWNNSSRVKPQRRSSLAAGNATRRDRRLLLLSGALAQVIDCGTVSRRYGVHKTSWLCNHIAYNQKTRPKNIAHGTYRIVKCSVYLELVAVSSMDPHPINYLATGCSTALTSVMRKEKDGTHSSVS